MGKSGSTSEVLSRKKSGEGSLLVSFAIEKCWITEVTCLLTSMTKIPRR